MNFISRYFGKSFVVCASLFILLSVTASAQTNFWWTNTVTSVTNSWSGGGN